MKCESYTEHVIDLVDGPAGAEQHRALERPLEVCETCRALVTDLRAIRGAAFTLDRLEPPAHVWDQVRARVSAEPRLQGGARILPFGMGVAAPRSWLAAAAALILATSIGVYSLVGGPREPPTESPEVATGPVEQDDLVASVEAELQAAESHYDKAIHGLEQIAKSDNAELEPQVAAVLQKNLQVIDQAIDESRAAVRAQPTSVNAQESLFDAMRNKVSLLQQTIELINEMRKGNQAEAGRIVQGLNQP